MNRKLINIIFYVYVITFFLVVLTGCRYNAKVNKWWNVNASADLYSNEIGEGNERRNAVPFGVRVSQNFNVFKDFSLQNFFMYRGGQIFIQGEMEPMWRFDLGGRYQFAKGKASVTAKVSDIFNTFYAKANLDNPYNSVGEFRWEAHTLFIGLNYNFGGKVKSRADKQQNKNENGSGGGMGF